MDVNRQQILKELGITLWSLRETESAAEDIVEYANPGVQRKDPNSEQKVDNWELLQTRVNQCALCSLSSSRKNPVFGSGSTRANWMFIGEAPGAEEDRLGLPFVGRAGQLLNSMLAALNLERDAVFISNVLKCRPPENRDPLGEEVRQCSPYLLEQIHTIQPEMIISMGRFAAQALLQTEQPIGKLRGKVHQFGEQSIPLVATYHPAYLLRSPLEKRKAWQDLVLARETFRARAKL